MDIIWVLISFRPNFCLNKSIEDQLILETKENRAIITVIALISVNKSLIQHLKVNSVTKNKT